MINRDEADAQTSENKNEAEIDQDANEEPVAQVQCLKWGVLRKQGYVCLKYKLPGDGQIIQALTRKPNLGKNV